MCFLALLYKVIPGHSVVVGANRDEFYDRPGLPPRELAEGVYGGFDPRGGGTWLGVNDAGILIGVTNLGTAGPMNPEARSRGLLCLDLLQQCDFARLRQDLEEAIRQAEYNNFNLLAASRDDAWRATCTEGAVRLRLLDPGIHVIGNMPAGAAREPKVIRGTSVLGEPRVLKAALQDLSTVCADHGSRADRADAICIHGTEAGTLSSSLIALDDECLSRSVYLHAEGPPCENEYQDFSDLLKPTDQV